MFSSILHDARVLDFNPLHGWAQSMFLISLLIVGFLFLQFDGLAGRDLLTFESTPAHNLLLNR
ncbi:hypothetical protein GALMADRAFT_242520 [Galerina marginata CBS 339.88]|uniref:Uncharacterized protein n=1 Tax=Galerina marginata (strain CBS 339.88) TaxID=685588 RepID=A0A067TMM7_GALM3|nr:hypothetical protein GALMADRAFT_242520 [Galerina marginata CBS 339.88]